MEVQTILWRRLDAAGHDACRLVRGGRGWRLEGAAAFHHKGVPACLAYEVGCDGNWRTQEGVVRGWVGARRLELRISRTPDGTWSLNGRAMPHVNAGCVDLDLGFTPATNLLQLRRLALQVGRGAEVAVAWLDVDQGALDTLHQRYERLSSDGYWYVANRFGYAALLRVAPVGFVETYPSLWERVRP